MLFHGSEKIIMNPTKFAGKANNDYGQGFYLTEDFDMAGEWACKNMKDGYINCYDIDYKNLKVLNLLDDKYNILNWLFLLLENRRFNLDQEIAKEGKKFIEKNFSIDSEKYDIIKGYRADDSYFSFADDFLNNTISYEKLKKAFSLGRLGIQIFINSEKAFKKLKFVKAHPAENLEYYPRYKFRDDEARKSYFKMKVGLKKEKYLNDFYLLDILRGGVDFASL